MLIVSDFSDYYDDLQHTLVPDSTQTIFYRRTKLEDPLTTHRTIQELNIRPIFHNKVSLFIIGFCGQIFPGVKLFNNTSYYTLTGALYQAKKYGIVLSEFEVQQITDHFSRNYEYLFPAVYPYYVLYQSDFRFILESNSCLMNYDFIKAVSSVKSYRTIETYVLVHGSFLEQTGWGGSSTLKKQLPLGY